MPARSLVVLCAALVLAGCTDAEDPEAGATAADSPMAPLVTAPMPGATPTAEGGLVLPILLEGSTATQAYVCVVPAPPCQYRSVVDGTSDLIIENVVGRIANGTLGLTWVAANPATDELAFGIMLMGGEGEGCAPMNLGSVRGTSPLAIDVKSSDRALCPGEVLHVWASNGIYVGEDPAYAQLDVDQPFRLEGNVTLSP